jgi:hypothetical protein
MGIVGVCLALIILVETKIAIPFFSTMLGDDFYFIDAMGPYMRWVQPKGISATLGT